MTTATDKLDVIVIGAGIAGASVAAELAGLRRLGVQPRRRTALLVSPPEAMALGGWPMGVDAQERVYLKPDAGKLLISPADETPSPPCDAQPEELDVAICVDRVETAFDLPIRRIEHKWAGLRSFLPDGVPAALLQGGPMPADIEDQGVTAADLSPDRPALAP